MFVIIAVIFCMNTQWISLEQHLNEHVVSVSRRANPDDSDSFNISPEIMYQLTTNPAKKFCDMDEDDTEPTVIETMVNLSGQKLIQFETGVREVIYHACGNDDTLVCDYIAL